MFSLAMNISIFLLWVVWCALLFQIRSQCRRLDRALRNNSAGESETLLLEQGSTDPLAAGRWYLRLRQYVRNVPSTTSSAVVRSIAHTLCTLTTIAEAIGFVLLLIVIVTIYAAWFGGEFRASHLPLGAS
jgi:hypothetical protein